jgi:PII-like signaling protein
MNPEDTTMEGIYLTFYLQENLRHEGRLVHEWLVDLARELELPGCSVFRSIGGYGHHRQVHSQSFVELQGTLPVEVAFALDENDARRLLDRVADEGLALFHVRMPARFGFTGR